ncbi:MAG: radical SAM protein [Thermoguttaceae bacterium]|nr:radical SAM protein [Thermoguttaceae bacterium]
MFKSIRQHFYFLNWYAQVRLLGRRRPLQTVLFVGDACNLRCKHCSVVPKEGTPCRKKDYETIAQELRRCYALGSRFVDFEGGEPFLWKDGQRDINDLFDLAREIGFFSTTVTTNAQIPFEPCRSDLVWISLDGVGAYHDKIRGEGAFARLEKNIATSSHPCLNANMVVNPLNVDAVEDTVRYVADHPKLKMLSVNFHTPFPGTEDLELDWETRCGVIDRLISLRKKGAPLMNTASGLRRMKDMRFKKRCWVTNFVMVDGAFCPQCLGSEYGLCERCGFGMASEMAGLWNLHPETILAGLKVRM